LTLHDYRRIEDRLRSVADPIGFLTNLFAHSPVAFAVWSAEGRALLTNQAFVDIFASEPPPEYNVLEDDILAANGMLALFRRAFAGETVHVPTFWYDPRDLKSVTVNEGRRVAISMTIFPLFKESGEVDYVAATYKDHTETMLANERLLLTEERFRLAQQAAHVGTFEWNVQTGVNTWTPEMEALHGLEPGEFGRTQESWERLIYPADRSAAVGSVNEAFETFLPTEGEWRVQWPDGSVHWLVGRFQVLKDEAGKPHRLIGVNMDVTERKNAEEARRQAEASVRPREESLRITLNSIGDAVIATDAEGRVTRMNPVAEQLTGWRLHEASGKNLTEVFRICNEETREPVENPVDRVLREGTVVGLANHTVLISRDGTERAIADSGAPIRDEQGDLHGVVLVFQDQTEQRKADQALERSEARFRRLSDSGILGIITTDFQGNITETNDGFLRMVGYTREEVLSGRVRWSEMTPPEWRALDERAIAQLKATGIAAPWEKEYIRKDGSRVPIVAGVAMLDRETGDCIAFILDRTEQKRAEAALLQSERRFRRLTESGTIGIVLSDTAGNIHEVNDAFLSIVGYSREDVLAGRLRGEDLNVPERNRTDAVARAQLQAEGVARPWEKELRRKDGSRVPVLNGVVMLDESTRECVTFVLDLSTLKRAEAAVRETEARKTAVMEAALDAIVLMDHEGRIVDFNPAAERTFGYSRDEVVGQPLADLIIPLSLRDTHRRAIARYLETERGNILGKRIEVPALRKDGTEFPAEVAVVRIRSEGSPLFTGYIRDITERRQAAEAETLRRAKEATEEVNAELEAFSYSVAHDLRSPLRGLSGFSTLLLDDYAERLDDKGKEYLRRIAASADRMSQIIDALLSLARLTRTEVHREPVDLSRLAHAVVDHLRAADPDRVVEVEVEEGLLVPGDSRLLRALLDNLLGNAWKFTSKRSRGRIEFGRERSEEGSIFFVRDNGVGFDMTHVQKLFAPFRRLHSIDQFEGTGIGLATAQRIVRRHGGRIWAEGTENEGAVFRFTLSADVPAGGRSWWPTR
jgi:PAS domain S-box-containing protein